MNRLHLSALFVLLACLTLTACGDDDTGNPQPSVQEGFIDLEMRFQTDADPSCNIASPVSHVAADGVFEVITVTLSGVIRAYDAETGEERWRKVIEAAEGESPIVLAPPLVLDGLLIFVWQFAEARDGVPDQGTWPKLSHHIQALDLTTHDWHPDYPRVQLAAEKTAWDGSTVAFDSSKQNARSRLAYLPVGEGRGLAYVSLGIGGGGQPYHGWLFEVDVDAWRDQGVDGAISASMLTTTDNDCAYDNEGTLFAEVCGGGVWSPAGPVETTDAQGNPELIIPTGNGRVHVERGSFAHGLLRVGPGLTFDPGCDMSLCSDFNEFDPALACLESCQSYFVPRLEPGETFQPENGICEGETFMECYGTLDADFGSSSPIEFSLPSGKRVIVHPAKDGALYLIDRDHMGTMLDRLQVIEPCGTETDRCPAGWAGQFVTQPVLFEDPETGDTLVIASGFNFDSTHPAGVVAARVVDDESPHLEVAWTAPAFDTPAAVEVFRRHTGRPILHEVEGVTYLFLVEPGDPGHIWVIRAQDGVLVAREEMGSYGVRYALPIIHDNTLYVGSCADNAGLAGGRLEAYDISVIEGGAPIEPDTDPDANPVIPRCEPGGTICTDGEYCERQVCGGPGLCLPRPASCDAPAGPEVCGCDGLSYPSRCEANRAGVHVDQEGPCGAP